MGGGGAALYAGEDEFTQAHFGRLLGRKTLYGP